MNSLQTAITNTECGHCRCKRQQPRGRGISQATVCGDCNVHQCPPFQKGLKWEETLGTVAAKRGDGDNPVAELDHTHSQRSVSGGSATVSAPSLHLAWPQVCCTDLADEVVMGVKGRLLSAPAWPPASAAASSLVYRPQLTVAPAIGHGGRRTPARAEAHIVAASHDLLKHLAPLPLWQDAHSMLENQHRQQADAMAPAPSPSSARVTMIMQHRTESSARALLMLSGPMSAPSKNVRGKPPPAGLAA